MIFTSGPALRGRVIVINRMRSTNQTTADPVFWFQPARLASGPDWRPAVNRRIAAILLTNCRFIVVERQ